MAQAPPTHVKALHDFGISFGIAFQMLDDLLDMTATQAEIGKPVGNDLRERKMTLPLILALRTGDRAFRTLVQGFYGEDRTEAAGEEITIGEIVTGITRLGIPTQSVEIIASHVEQAKMSLAPLGNAPTRSNLAKLADTLVRGAERR